MPRPHDKDDDYFTDDCGEDFPLYDHEDDIPVDDEDEAQEEREIDEESDDPDAWDDDDDDIKYLFDDDGAVSHRGMAILAEMDRNGHFV